VSHDGQLKSTTALASPFRMPAKVLFTGTTDPIILSSRDTHGFALATP